MPVGPLTNVALALDRGIRPARIVLMGGAIAEGNMTPAAEFNIWADPEAAARVFASGLDVTMIGPRRHARRAPDAGVGGAVPRRRAGSAPSSRSWSSSSSSTTSAPTAGTARRSTTRSRSRTSFRPGIVRTEHLNVEVELESELNRGRTVVDRWHRTDRAPNAHVGVEIDADAFLELLLERIATLG